MRILSFGDIHIGTECDPDIREAAKKIAATAAEEQPDLIVITGDVYDGESSPGDRELSRDIVTMMADISPVRIIKGNHDTRKDLLILGSLKANFPITVHEQPFCSEYRVQDGDPVFIHYLPWLTKAAWVAGQVGIDMGITAGNEAVSLLALQYLKIQISKRGPGKHLLYAHLMISGSRAENHQPLLGEGITFGYHDLVEAGFCGGAFGHIHLAQEFGNQAEGSPEFRYNGAIAALNYGESARNKTFSILDTESLTTRTFVIDSIARINLNASWGAAGLEWADPELLPTESGARVKVKLLIDEGFSSDDAEAAVRSYPGIVDPLELKVERQSKPRDTVRSQEIAAAKTACQKLEAYWAATQSTPDEPMRTQMLNITLEAETECSTKIDRK